MRYLQEQATTFVDRFEASACPSLQPSAYLRVPTKLLSLAYGLLLMYSILRYSSIYIEPS